MRLILPFSLWIPRVLILHAAEGQKQEADELRPLVMQMSNQYHSDWVENVLGFVFFKPLPVWLWELKTHRFRCVNCSSSLHDFFFFFFSPLPIISESGWDLWNRFWDSGFITFCLPDFLHANVFFLLVGRTTGPNDHIEVGTDHNLFNKRNPKSPSLFLPSVCAPSPL